MVSNAYTLIVLGADDIVGFVAYSLYKEDKMRFVSDYMTKKGEPPHREAMEVYLNSVLSEVSIQRFRQQALGIVHQILESTAQVQIDQAIEVLRHKQIEAIDARICKHKTSNWTAIGLGVASSFIFALLLTLCQIIAMSVGGDLFSIFK